MPTTQLEVEVCVNAPRHLEQYAGLWLMESGAFQSLADYVRGIDLSAHVQASGPGPQSRVAGATESYSVGDDGIADLAIDGTMTKYGSSFSEFPGTVVMRRQLRAAKNDAKVRGVWVRIDSPGGSHYGVVDLADEIAAVAAVKPVWSGIEDLGASAAYYVASQSTRIIANRSAFVGSIGTYGVVRDSSARYAEAGIRVYVIRSGIHKGVGTPGDAITEEQLAELQAKVDEIHAAFVADVARGRKMKVEAVEALADGRLFVAPAALQAGLIDAVDDLDRARAELAAEVSQTSGRRTGGQNTERTKMSGDQTKPAPATLEQLKAACPKATAEFLLAQLDASATQDQASRAWMAEQAKALDAANAALAEQKEKLAAAEAKATTAGGQGHEPARDGAESGDTTYDGGPMAEWNRRRVELIASGKTPEAAVKHLARTDPGLHRAALEEHNAAHGKTMAGFVAR